MHTERACTVAVVIALILPGSSYAQPQAAASRDTRDAVAWATLGLEHFKSERYDEAIEAFEAGYELFGDPQFLINIAVSEQRLGDHEGALATLKRLEALPRSSDEQRVVSASLTVASEAVLRAEALARASGDGLEATGPEAPWSAKPLQWGLLGAGGTGLLLSGWFARRAAVGIEELERQRARGEREEYDQTRERVERARRAGRVSLIAGGALAAAGVIVIVARPDTEREEETRAQLEVAIAPRAVRLSLRW